MNGYANDAQSSHCGTRADRGPSFGRSCAVRSLGIGVLVRLLLVLVLAAGGCRPAAKEAMPLDRNAAHRALRDYGWQIVDGHGSELGPDNQDYFALFLAMLKHPVLSVREAAAQHIAVSVMLGDVYAHVLDGFIDGGRGEELVQALREAWTTAEPDSGERLSMVAAFLDVRRRQRVWREPDLAGTMGLRAMDPPRRGWTGFHSPDLDAKLIEEGDEEVIAALAEQEHLLELLHAGVLKGVRPFPWQRQTTAEDVDALLKARELAQPD